MLSTQRLYYKFVAFAIVAVLGLHFNSASAQIYSDQDEQQLIPGTQNITPGPGIDLSNWNTTGHSLEYATIQNTDLTSASFNSSNLASSNLIGSTLVNVDFSNTILSNSELMSTNVTGANFTGAAIDGVYFDYVKGLTAAQFYSTATYQGTVLNVGLSGMDLSGWNFANKDISRMNLSDSDLTNVNFSGAIIVGRFPGSYSYGTIFSDVKNFTEAQFYSTASYQNHNLESVRLWGMDMVGWDFANQNLEGASIDNNSDLADADLSNTNCIGAFMATSNFTDTNFTNAMLSGATMVGCNMTNANLTGAEIDGADFDQAIGLTVAQLYTTQSYQTYNFSGRFDNVNLTGMDFTNQNLSYSTFESCNLAGLNFSGTAMNNTDFFGADLRGAINWNGINANTQNAILPNGTIQGLVTNDSEETLIIRNNPIPVIVTIVATFDPTSTLQFLLDTNWTSPMGFSAGIVPSLAGTLDLEFASDANPAAMIGDTFQLFNWNGPLPIGDQFNTITTEPGFVWDTSQLYTAGTVTLDAVPEPVSASTVAIAAIALVASRRR